MAAQIEGRDADDIRSKFEGIADLMDERLLELNKRIMDSYTVVQQFPPAVQMAIRSIHQIQFGKMSAENMQALQVSLQVAQQREQDFEKLTRKLAAANKMLDHFSPGIAKKLEDDVEAEFKPVGAPQLGEVVN